MRVRTGCKKVHAGPSLSNRHTYAMPEPPHASSQHAPHAGVHAARMQPSHASRMRRMQRPRSMHGARMAQAPRAAPQQHGADLQRGAPLVLQDVEADAPQLVDVGVVDLGQETDLGEACGRGESMRVPCVCSCIGGGMLSTLGWYGRSWSGNGPGGEHVCVVCAAALLGACVDVWAVDLGSETNLAWRGSRQVRAACGHAAGACRLHAARCKLRAASWYSNVMVHTAQRTLGGAMG